MRGISGRPKVSWVHAANNPLPIQLFFMEGTELVEDFEPKKPHSKSSDVCKNFYSCGWYMEPSVTVTTIKILDINCPSNSYSGAWSFCCKVYITRLATRRAKDSVTREKLKNVWLTRSQNLCSSLHWTAQWKDLELNSRHGGEDPFYQAHDCFEHFQDCFRPRLLSELEGIRA